MARLGRVLRTAVTRAVGQERLERWFFEDLARRGTLCYRDFGDHRLVFDPSESIGRRIHAEGGFHRDVTRMVFEAATGGRRGGVFLEIGANIGTQTVYALVSGLFDRIVAVEPDPHNFRVLETNIGLNGGGATVDRACLAFSDRAGDARLTRHSGHSGASTLETLADADRVRPETDPVVTVETVTGDAYLDAAGIEPGAIALVWMDVEQHEAPVLAGLERMLAARPPLYFEVAPDQPDARRLETIDALVLSRYAHLYAETGRFEPISRDDVLAGRLPRPGRVNNLLAIDRPIL